MVEQGQLFVASITPINDKEELHIAALEEHFDFLVDGGVSGVTFCGTTGEFPALSEKQREQLLSHAIKYNRNRVKIMAGIGGNTTRQAIHNLKQAEKCGVDSVLLLTPWFEKTGLEAVSSYVTSICENSSVPVYLYHHPYRTNFDWHVEHILELATKYPKQIIGIKDSSCDFSRMKQYSDNKPKNFQVFFECPDQFKTAHALGAIGCIDGLANLIPHEAVKAMSGCEASIKNYTMVRKVLATSNNYIGLLRFGLEQLGMNPGPCFAPNQFVRPEEKEALVQSLEAIGRLQCI